MGDCWTLEPVISTPWSLVFAVTAVLEMEINPQMEIAILGMYKVTVVHNLELIEVLLSFNNISVAFASVSVKFIIQYYTS